MPMLLFNSLTHSKEPFESGDPRLSRRLCLDERGELTDAATKYGLYLGDDRNLSPSR
jgi:hypothetical protein